MPEKLYIRNPNGTVVEWHRVRVRSLANDSAAMGGGIDAAADEKFLENLIAARPDLLGIAEADDESDIEGPFRVFAQLPIRALNGRIIYPDLVLLSQNGQVIIVEVKLSDNSELKDRQVVAQVLEYAASLAQHSEEELFELFCRQSSGASNWAQLVRQFFPEAGDPDRLAKRLLAKFRTSDLHLVIACDEIPPGLQELVKGVVTQSALGEFKFRVVEIMPFTAGTQDSTIIFLRHTRLTTEIVARTAVTITYGNEQNDRRPEISVRVTSLEDVERQTQRVREQSVGRAWTEQLFFEDAKERAGAPALAALRSVYDAARNRDYPIRWGKGIKSGSFSFVIPGLSDRTACSFFSDGTMWANFGNMGARTAQDLREALLALPGVSFADSPYPSIKAQMWIPHADRLLQVFESIAEASE